MQTVPVVGLPVSFGGVVRLAQYPAVRYGDIIRGLMIAIVFNDKYHDLQNQNDCIEVYQLYADGLLFSNVTSVTTIAKAHTLVFDGNAANRNSHLENHNMSSISR